MKNGAVWCDASIIFTRVIQEIGGVVLEDAAKLRKKNDCNHINVVDLDSILKGVNLTLV